jgi:hypothetical protein
MVPGPSRPRPRAYVAVGWGLFVPLERKKSSVCCWQVGPGSVPPFCSWEGQGRKSPSSDPFTRLIVGDACAVPCDDDASSVINLINPR